MRLLNVLDVESIPAAGRFRQRLPFELALCELLLAHVEMNFPRGHVELDHVPVLHERERSARRCFRRHMQHDGAVRRAAHARIGNAHHVRYALLQHLGRQRHVADFRHARITLRAAVLEHEHARFIDVEIVAVDARVEVFDVLEHDRPAAMLHQMRRCRRRLHHGTVRREIAVQHGDTCLGLEWVVLGANDLAVVARRGLDVLSHRPAVDGQRIEVEKRGDLAQHGRQAARVIEILHEVFARGLQVHEAGHVRGEPIEILEREGDADAASECEQVDHRVRRAADRCIRANCILEGGARQHLRHAQILVHHLHDAPAGELRKPFAARVGCGNRGVFRERHAERLHHARHRRGGAHRHAVALRSMHARFGGREFLHRHLAGAHFLRHFPHAGPGADRRAAEASVQHRAAR